MLGLGYTAALVVDPYDAIGFSPQLDRRPIPERRRFTLPSVARNPRFDSLILGTSTSMLLRPEHFDELFQAGFANLAMPSATPYEQLRLLSLFAASRPSIDTLIIGVDGAWCSTYKAPDFVDDQARQGFPGWMYDQSRLNDFPALNTNLVTDTLRQIAIVLGNRTLAGRPDGYYEFPTQRYRRYDPVKVRRKLHGVELPLFRGIPAAIVSAQKTEPSTWVFDDIDALEHALAALPPASRKILHLVPYHFNILPDEESLAARAWEACKVKLGDISRRVDNVYVVDLMIPSALTRTDSNYWDPVHYTMGVAAEVARILNRAVSAPDQLSSTYRVLAAPNIASATVSAQP
jgi:hypothetical protein